MKIFACAILSLFAVSANAALIDTTSTSGAATVNGWGGSGQSFSVDASATFFDDLTFHFSSASNGQTFDFILSDALNGGASLFSTSFTVENGLGFIDIDTDLAAGSSVYGLVDYNGYTGMSAYYQKDIYAGGNSFFTRGSGKSANEFGGAYDHVFEANFSGNPNIDIPRNQLVIEGIPELDTTEVPEPFSIVLVGLGLAALGFARRRKTA